LNEDCDRVREELGELKEAVVEHRVRLENGVKVFADQKARLETIEQKIAPSPFKIISVTVGIFLVGAGSLWGLANMLRDRPTLEQVEKVMDKHEDNGHPALRQDVRAIQTEIQGVQTEQKRQGAKLDTLLERVPAQ
jgi:hypothetical protein